MTFVVRCLAVSLTFFLISYCGVSIAVGRGWRLVQRRARGLSPRRLADLLFLLRALPVASGVVVTLAFVVPSFLLLEPETSAEPIGELPMALGLCCLVMLALGAGNALATYLKASRTVDSWLKNATALPSQGSVAMFRIRPEVPALTLVGLREPRVLLSEAAATVLAERELEIALKHELAHVRRWDNFKKLFFCFWAFPGMVALEEAWNGVEEMAADDEAASCAGDALDLASALIKLSRLSSVHPATALTSALVHSSASSVNARVERLVAWSDTRPTESARAVPWFIRSAMYGTALGVLLTYGAALHSLHAATEWLVR